MLPRYHRLFTTNALQDLFNEPELNEVISGNLKQDHISGQFGHPEFHFDDSEFERTYTYLEKLRSGIIQKVIEGNNFADARFDLGRLTHAVQDFYAHTNYIRLWAQKNRITPDTWNGEIDFLDMEIINSKDLISGHFNPPWEMITFLPIIGYLFIPLFPKDSHAALNIDSPYKNDWFPFASKAAEMRTRFEVEQLIKTINEEKSGNLTIFLGKEIYPGKGV